MTIKDTIAELDSLARKASPAIPRPEYPRPQWVRSRWLNLNGDWNFELDPGDSGFSRGLSGMPASPGESDGNGRREEPRDLKNRIVVPFCPESRLSGVDNQDFHNAVWYRKEVTIPSEWADCHTILHFQAVDYDATVWVNGVEVGRHRGGFTPFELDLDGVVSPGAKANIVVRARDDHRLPTPKGKQTRTYENRGCDYTRTTGIWQTVWLEPVSPTYLRRPRIAPDLAASAFRITVPVVGPRVGMTLSVEVRADGVSIATRTVPIDVDFQPTIDAVIPSDRLHLWSPQDPFLYDLTFELLDDQGNCLDRVMSYAGMRSVTIRGKAILINGHPEFQRLVLDQGYYPDGIMTAPTDAALLRDIELAKEAGFNGARLHQKVFEERFLFHADLNGYLLWGEFADWGCGGFGPAEDHQQPSATYITQWLEVLERDFSHPAIVGWCPLNETWQGITDKVRVLDDVTLGLFLATKAFDLTRPVLDASGYSHRVPETDVYDSHSYEQDVPKFAQMMSGLSSGRPHVNVGDRAVAFSTPYRGQPYFCSEFGGIWWSPGARPGEVTWGYGDRPQSEEEYYERFAALCHVLLSNPDMFGYCYTQLTDVFQEQTGVVAFDRSYKLDLRRLKKAQDRVAAIEMGTK